MTAEQAQVALTLPQFAGVVGVLLILVVAALVIDGEQKIRAERRRLDFERHCEQALGIGLDEPVPFWPVDELAARRLFREGK